jgi:hypothetical protein
LSLLSPAATYHAELREQLSGVGRALALQRALVWLSRGLAAGSVVVVGVVLWAWIRDGIASLPLLLLAAVPLLAAAVLALVSLVVRHDVRELARKVDHAASLRERSTTALELGARGEEFPLALAQMRDAVEHLKRVDLLESFPLKLPKNELMATFFLLVVAALVGIAPNPWLLRARASNPSINIAREQAQRVERLADSIRTEDAPELDPLRELLRKGARTIDARSNEPEDALNALEDLEEQVHQMSAGDDQLAAALAAVASALASDPATEQLASAINTGDLREISRAAKELAQQAESLTGQDRERVGRVLRDASNRAGRASPSVAGELADAAAALQSGGEGADGNDAQSGAMRETSGGQPGGSPSSSAQNGRGARDALNQLSSDAAAAAERQRAESQLESSRNALERALGRTQSRSASGRSSSSNSSRNQGAGGQAGDRGQGGSPGQGNEAGEGAGDQASGGGTPGEEGGQGDGGEGGGYSTGGQNLNRSGVSELDTITRPEQVPSSSTFLPDESSINPYLGDASDGSSRAGDESVQPSFSRKPTQGNDSGAIPLGLRDLVKDYFSSLDQK